MQGACQHLEYRAMRVRDCKTTQTSKATHRRLYSGVVLPAAVGKLSGSGTGSHRGPPAASGSPFSEDHHRVSYQRCLFSMLSKLKINLSGRKEGEGRELDSNVIVCSVI